MLIGRLGPVARRCLRAMVVLSGSAAVIVPGLGPAGHTAAAQTLAGPWVLTGWRLVGAAHSDQGLATIMLPHGRERLVLRGNADVSAAMRARGWWHVGDPGSYGGYLVDAYQGNPAMGEKLFVVTAPDGRRTAWLHRVVAGESVNNSFAAVDPSGRWLVSGEWGTVRRLLVFPMPGRNAAARPGHDLPLAAVIRLTRPVTDVQGCDFAAALRLICATNDPHRTVYGVARQLLRVRLARGLDGRDVRGFPSLLGAVPQVSACGVAETEGLDVHGGRLLVVAHEAGACSGSTVLFTYRLRDPPRWP